MKIISKSSLDEVNKSAAHFYLKYLSGIKQEYIQTDEMLIGEAFHKLLLEPLQFDSNFAVYDDTQDLKDIGGSKPKSTNWYKGKLEEIKQINFGKKIILQNDFDLIQEMRDVFMQNANARYMIDSGFAEKKRFFTEPNTGLPCQYLTDFHNTNLDIFVDIKTTKDASSSEFAKSCANYRYHVQDSFYSDGYFNETGDKIKGFYFIAIEKTKPYNLAIYCLNEESKDLGREEYLRNMNTIKNCYQSGIWQGYTEKIQQISLPRYYFNKFQ